MTERKKRLRLYQLLDAYLSRRIDGNAFSRDFHALFDIGMDTSLLAPRERELFGALVEVAGRFNDTEEDIEKYPRAFVQDDELRTYVQRVKEALDALNASTPDEASPARTTPDP